MSNVERRNNYRRRIFSFNRTSERRSISFIAESTFDHFDKTKRNFEISRTDSDRKFLRKFNFSAEKQRQILSFEHFSLRKQKTGRKICSIEQNFNLQQKRRFSRKFFWMRSLAKNFERIDLSTTKYSAWVINGIEHSRFSMIFVCISVDFSDETRLKPVLLLVNPAGGAGKAERLVSENVVGVWREANFPYQIILTGSNLFLFSKSTKSSGNIFTRIRNIETPQRRTGFPIRSPSTSDWSNDSSADFDLPGWTLTIDMKNNETPKKIYRSDRLTETIQTFSHRMETINLSSWEVLRFVEADFLSEFVGRLIKHEAFP